VAAKKVLVPYDFTKNEIQNAVVQLLASDPGSPSNGQIWVNSTSWTLNVRLNGVTITLGRLDQLNAPTISVNFNSQKGINAADPTNPQDVATMQWTSNLVAASSGGTEWKQQVRLATTGALATNTYSSGAKTLTATANGALSIDGTAVVVADRILVKNESTGSNNGLYVVTATGGAGAPYVLTRATDANTSALLNNGMIVPVAVGTTNADTIWVMTTDSITLDTTALSFTQLPIAGYTAGTGLTLTGNQFALTVPVTVANGGTGAITAAAARTALGIVNKYTVTGPSSGGTSWTINHNLGTSDVIYMIRDASTNAEPIVDIVVTDANNLTVNFGSSVSSNSYKAVVIG
jgi:hypothetical protein